MFETNREQNQPLLVNRPHSTAIRLHNEEETQRISDIIKEFLGVLTKFSAKLPKPVVAVLLAIAWAAPIMTDAGLSQNTGNLWSLIFKAENTSLLLNTLCSGFGLYSFYKAVSLFKKADKAAHSLDSDLMVRVTADPITEELKSANVLLAAQKLVLEDQLSRVQRNIDQKEGFIRGLIEVIQQLPQAQKETTIVKDLLQQLIHSINARSTSTTGEVERLLSTNPVSYGSSVKQSVRLMSVPASGRSASQEASLDETHDDIDSRHASSASIATC